MARNVVSDSDIPLRSMVDVLVKAKLSAYEFSYAHLQARPDTLAG